MPIPPPRYQSSEQRAVINGNAVTLPAGAMQDMNRARAIEVAQLAGTFVDCPDASGAALASMDRECGAAGLFPDWRAVKAAARSAGKAVPGHFLPMVGRPDTSERFNFDTRGAEKRRAWAYVFAPGVIDQTVEQTVDFVAFNWW